MYIKKKFSLDDFIDSWCKITLIILFTIISLSPLATAILCAILASPWYLFILASYLFIGPYIVIGYACLLDID